MQKKLKVLFLIAIFLTCFRVSSQELDAVVDVDVSALNIDIRDRLSNFKNDVQNYLNKTRFTDENIINDVRGKPYKIKCSFQFFFQNSTGFDSYSAQMVDQCFKECLQDG